MEASEIHGENGENPRGIHQALHTQGFQGMIYLGSPDTK